MHYAAKFLECIASLYLDAPVVDIYSWSGGFFSSKGSPAECGHHPHSLDDPQPVKDFLMENRACLSEGNAFRINDQMITEYPLTLIVHDKENA